MRRPSGCHTAARRHRAAPQQPAVPAGRPMARGLAWYAPRSWRLRQQGAQLGTVYRARLDQIGPAGVIYAIEVLLRFLGAEGQRLNACLRVPLLFTFTLCAPVARLRFEFE